MTGAFADIVRQKIKKQKRELMRGNRKRQGGQGEAGDARAAKSGAMKFFEMRVGRAMSSRAVQGRRTMCEVNLN